MQRGLLISVLLALLTVSSANGSPKSPAKPHGKLVPASNVHNKTGEAARPTGGRAARCRTERETGRKAVRKSDTARKVAAERQPAQTETSAKRPFRFRRATRRPLAVNFTPVAAPAAVSVAAADAAPEVQPVAPFAGEERLSMPPPLRGSLESLTRQNEKTEADGLERIEDDSDLNDRIARGMLVPVPVSAALTVNGKLPENRRYCRPWTASFLTDLARSHSARFHTALEVSSAVRTVAYQKQLIRVNGNAASAEGDIASPHLTGASIDIAKQGMTREEIGWMRAQLLSLQDAGKIDVEEEFQQSCFHITVYKSYLPPKPERPAAEQAKSTPAAPQAKPEEGPAKPGRKSRSKAGKQRPEPPAPVKQQPAEPPAGAPAGDPVEG